jgi:hypothetical protein
VYSLAVFGLVSTTLHGTIGMNFKFACAQVLSMKQLAKSMKTNAESGLVIDLPRGGDLSSFASLDCELLAIVWNQNLLKSRVIFLLIPDIFDQVRATRNYISTLINSFQNHRP